MKTARLFAGLIALAATSIALSQQERPRPDQPRPEQPRTDQNRDQGDRAAREDQPGPEHNVLQSLVGTWQLSGTCYGPKTDKAGGNADSQDRAAQAGTDEGQPVGGTLTSEWALDKHFVKCHLRGTEGSRTIEGMGLTGYDNAKDKYVSSWADNQCTSIKMEEGTYDPSSKTFTFTGESKTLDGKTAKCRRIIQIKSDNEHTMTVFVTESGQAEKKVLEATFRRTSSTARSGER